MCIVEDPIEFEYGFVAGSALPDGRHKSIMRRMGKYAGGVTHVQLTIPTYLIETIDGFTSSRSAYITLAVEKQMRYSGLLGRKFPSLGLLYRALVHMDLYVMRFKSEGGRTLETDRMMRAYRSYFKRFERMMLRRIEDIARVRRSWLGVRVEIKEPYIRTRPDRRRQTDSDSEADLGAEAFADKPEDKNEMYRTDRDRFKRLFPVEYAERRRQDEERLEDDRQDPAGWEEDGDDPPEK